MKLNLYESGPIPNARPCDKVENYNKNAGGIGIVANVTKPTLEVFMPKNQNAARSSVIICPGGGYGVLAVDHEGYDVAKAFNEMGITAFVLKYRLPDSACMTHRENVPLTDAQQAFKIVRENAGKWKIDTGKVGIMGFSAGGHLASTVGTHFNQRQISNTSVSFRPDFMLLLYPVISFNDSICHKGSKENLIGKNAPAALEHLYSNEEQVTAQTPPTFLVHAADDDAVPVANSTRFFEMLVKYKVPAEMHIYQNGGHGFGMHNKTTTDDWMERLKNWLSANKFLL